MGIQKSTRKIFGKFSRSGRPRTKAKSTGIWYSQSKLERMDMMNCLMDWFETVGRARAANVLVQMGMHKEAKKLMTERRR